MFCYAPIHPAPFCTFSSRPTVGRVQQMTTQFGKQIHPYLGYLINLLIKTAYYVQLGFVLITKGNYFKNGQFSFPYSSINFQSWIEPQPPGPPSILGVLNPTFTRVRVTMSVGCSCDGRQGQHKHFSMHCSDSSKVESR